MITVFALVIGAVGYAGWGIFLGGRWAYETWRRFYLWSQRAPERTAMAQIDQAYAQAMCRAAELVRTYR